MEPPRSTVSILAMLGAPSADAVTVRNASPNPPRASTDCIAVFGSNGVLITWTEANNLVVAGATDRRYCSLVTPMTSVALEPIVAAPRRRRRASTR